MTSATGSRGCRSERPRRPEVHVRAPVALDAFLGARTDAAERCFPPQADAIARLCHAMAERFARGGRLVAIGTGDIALSDVAHVVVEFVHPVIVGKRALPALGVRPRDVGLLVERDDIVLAFGHGEEVHRAVGDARQAGALTVAFTALGAEHEITVEADDPFVAQEIAETAYHVLWELVHVFFEHRGLLEGRTPGSARDSGASSFLYPFLGERETDLDGVLRDVAGTVVAKAREADALRVATVTGGRDALTGAARALRACFDAGGRLLALGNGGSATDAMDAAADLLDPPPRAPGTGRATLVPRPAIDLTAQPAVLTALANDVGVAPMFQRQVIAHGRPGDALLAFSTSGGSENVLAALDHARRLGLVTVALVGYDGGRIAADELADHVVVTPSEHIPRIQEAQATAWHLLRELVEDPPR
jgi:D-sedoheptulose 7-phosphate isomerase